jgi:hypothetical protein
MASSSPPIANPVAEPIDSKCRSLKDTAAAKALETRRRFDAKDALNTIQKLSGETAQILLPRLWKQCQPLHSAQGQCQAYLERRNHFRSLWWYQIGKDREDDRKIMTRRTVFTYEHLALTHELKSPVEVGPCFLYSWAHRCCHERVQVPLSIVSARDLRGRIIAAFGQNITERTLLSNHRTQAWNVSLRFRNDSWNVFQLRSDSTCAFSGISSIALRAVELTNRLATESTPEPLLHCSVDCWKTDESTKQRTEWEVSPINNVVRVGAVSALFV